MALVPTVARTASIESRRLVAVGALALGGGALVYLVDRALSNASPWPFFAPLATAPWFGSPGAWLPSLVHPFAFGLFTAAALPRGPRPAYGACFAWWAVNVAFEAAQHPALGRPLVAMLREAFGEGLHTAPFIRFIRHGTFDPADLAAVTAGALAAALVLRLVHSRED